MGNIVNDIVDEVNIKPNNTKKIIKIIISIAIACMGVAFAFGQFKTSFFNRMDKMEEKIVGNAVAIGQLKTDMHKGFDETNLKVDKVYADGLLIFNNFQDYNNKQLELIVDYGNGNKDMLKRMLEISSLKQQQEIANQVDASKQEPPKHESDVVAIPFLEDDYIKMVYFTVVETQDTIFNVTGATKKFVENIDKNKYEVGPVLENKRYQDLYDVSYRKKR